MGTLLLLWSTSHAGIVHGSISAEWGQGFDSRTAAAIIGIYGGAFYLAALPEGWLADNWFGKRRAVWYGSTLIALGHLSIATSAVVGREGFFIGLFLGCL